MPRFICNVVCHLDIRRILIGSPTDTTRTTAPASEFSALLGLTHFFGAWFPGSIRCRWMARIRQDRKRLCAWIGRPISRSSGRHPLRGRWRDRHDFDRTPLDASVSGSAQNQHVIQCKRRSRGRGSRSDIHLNPGINIRAPDPMECGVLKREPCASALGSRPPNAERRTVNAER